MGQKINPICFRLPVFREWRSKWFAQGKELSEFIVGDFRIRQYLHKKLKQASVSKILIERAWNSIRVTICTARPGIVIGRKGSEIEKMTEDIHRFNSGKQVKIDIVEIKSWETDARLIAENIAMQIERRVSFRRAMKKAMQTTMESGAEGVKVRCSGRLGGAEISRCEWYREGKIPLHTIRVNIDYGFAEAQTTYGIIGVKCWLNRKPESNKHSANLNSNR